MILKCTFSTPHGRNQELTERLESLSPLSKYIVRKGVHTKSADGKSPESITIFYEFEESRLMEATREIFKQIDAFSDIPGFRFSSQVWTETLKAPKSMSETAPKSQDCCK